MEFDIIKVILKLVVCILLRVLGQVQGFRLTQHLLNILFSNRYTNKIFKTVLR
jgi:hypothetical protein